MGNGLCVDEARRVRDALTAASIFEAIHIEMDSGEIPTDPQEG